MALEAAEKGKYLSEIDNCKAILILYKLNTDKEILFSITLRINQIIEAEGRTKEVYVCRVLRL